MATRMQQRRGTAAQWLSTNSGNGPILNAGEIGYETDTNKFKIGDGVNHWIDLNYFADTVELGGNIDDYIPLTQKGVANGVATLNSSGVIPSEQIPSLVGLDTEITTAVTNAIADLVDGAPAALNTLNELAASLGNDEDFATSVITALGDKQSKISGVSDTEIGYLSNVTADIQGQIDSKANSDDMTTALGFKADSADLAENAIDAVAGAINTGSGLTHSYDDTANTITLDVDSTIATKTYADDAVSTHSSDSTNVHGIDDTTQLATKTFAANLLVNATKTNIQITGDKDGITIIAENGVADSTTDNLSEGTTNKYYTDARVETKLDASTGTGLDWDNTAKTIYIDETVVQKRVANVSDAEIGYLDGVTSAIQTQLNDKSPIASPTFTGTVTVPTLSVTTTATGITKSMVGLANADNTSDSDKPVSSATQTALDAKAPIASPTFTGTVAGITKSMVGLGNVDNTSDANKPVSSATQTALDLKANLAGAAFSGAVSVTDTTQSTSTSTGAIKTAGGLGVAKNAYIGGNLDIAGDFTVSGTTTTVNTANLNVTDPMIYMGDGNSSNLLDLGIVSAFNDGTYQHTGLVRDSSANTWKLFKGVTDEPTTTVNFTQGSLDDLAVGGLTASSITVGSVSNTEFGYLDGVTSAIQTQINSKLNTSTAASTYAPIASPTFTGTVAGITKSMVDLGNVDNTSDANKPVSTATQTALDAKAPLASPTFTGTVAGITKSMVGLGNVDNTSDANKPVSTATQTALDAKLTSTVTINAQTANYTLVLSDKDKMVEMNVGSANTLTVPTNSSVALPVGSKINIVQTGSGQTTLTPGAGVTINGTPGLKTRAQWSAVTLVKRATDTWVAFGDLTA